MSDINIKCTNLTFKYRDNVILDNVNLDIKGKNFICISGANGTGKSTLIGVLLGVNENYSGVVERKGFDTVSYIQQKATNINKQLPMNVYEVVSLGIKSKAKKATKKKLVADALCTVGLDGLYKRKLNELSGGQLQRVFIAKAIVEHPSVMVLDEPTSSIDEKTSEEICCTLANISKQNNIVTIMVTHSIKSIVDHADAVIYFDDNKKVSLLSNEQYRNAINYK